MMMYSRLIKPALFTVFAVVLMQTTQAQDHDISSKYSFDFNKTIPGIPENASLGSYGNTPVSTATGKPDISFNLYTVNYGGVSIPVTIAYDPSGIKYSDIPSSLGMKWSLSAGGSVDRSVNGIIDEDYLMLWPQAIDSVFLEYEHIHNTRQGAIDTFTRIAKNQYDCSRDTYYYSYPGNSGSMYLGNGNRFYPDHDYTKVKISAASHLDTFKIRDDRGNTYLYFAYLDQQTTYISGRLSKISRTSFGGRVS
ncbi:MAG: hypothetical protein JST39_04410, partial [Bacteroidetes bacterium]|nr:hypothetical protein [Bacteroidota bacterium]